VATIIATTLLTTIQPHEKADQFRFGQLRLERAINRYGGIVGRPKTQADVDAVLAAYDQAEGMLSGGIDTLADRVSKSTNPTPSEPTK
jgi:hypothetical protein